MALEIYIVDNNTFIEQGRKEYGMNNFRGLICLYPALILRKKVKPMDTSLFIQVEF